MFGMVQLTVILFPSPILPQIFVYCIVLPAAAALRINYGYQPSLATNKSVGPVHGGIAMSCLHPLMALSQLAWMRRESAPVHATDMHCLAS